MNIYDINTIGDGKNAYTAELTKRAETIDIL